MTTEEQQMAMDFTAYSAQARELKRVKSKLEERVCEFALNHVNQEFHMRELVAFVTAEIPCSPDSPSRILRSLGQSGVIGYEVVNRAQSLYTITHCNQEG